MLICPTLALRQAAPWPWKMSATSNPWRRTAAGYTPLRALPSIGGTSLSSGLVTVRIVVWRHGCNAPWCRAWRGRAVPRPAPGQALDDADVGILFEQMGGEAVPQGMRRHPFLNPSGLSGGVNGAVELTGRQRLDWIGSVRNLV
jgi:hypothetical protein